MTHSTQPEPIVFVPAFSDPEAARRYADGPKCFVPSFEAFYQMSGPLLAEYAPPDARLLVIGAGGCR